MAERIKDIPPHKESVVQYQQVCLTCGWENTPNTDQALSRVEGWIHIMTMLNHDHSMQELSWLIMTSVYLLE